MPAYVSKQRMPVAESFHSLWVVFPAALYTSSFVGFAIFAVTRDPFFWDVALFTNLIGLVTALVAAATGAYADAHRPSADHSLRALVRRHVLFHTQAFIYFALNVIVHSDQFFRSRATLRALASGVTLPDLDATLPVILTGAGLLSTLVAAQAGFLIAARRKGLSRSVPRSPRMHAPRPANASGRA